MKMLRHHFKKQKPFVEPVTEIIRQEKTLSEVQNLVLNKLKSGTCDVFQDPGVLGIDNIMVINDYIKKIRSLLLPYRNKLDEDYNHNTWRVNKLIEDLRELVIETDQIIENFNCEFDYMKTHFDIKPL